MSSLPHAGASRRDLLKAAAPAAAASALAGVAIPHVHAASSDTIRLALIGCGGRGTGAAMDALSPKNAPIKLVALADVFPERVQHAAGQLNKLGDRVDVPQDRQFVGLDGYKKAMDCLKPGDVAIMATPPAFRWVHMTYAIDRGLNAFMEKPVTVDGPSTRRMLKLAEEAKKKNLKVGVGLMCRHCRAREALYARIKAGQIGDILMIRAYRMHGPLGASAVGPKPEGQNELLFQIQRFHGFLWASGGAYSDFYIHNIDECCWMKDAWPVRAQAVGGRHYRGDAVDQNFDAYSVEYTFADGTKFFLYGRCISGAHTEFASYAHGTKGSAVISTSAHSPAKCRIYKGQDLAKAEDLVWSFPPPEPNPYVVEWEDLVAAIRQDKPYNEIERGAIASLVTSMGRMAAHTGRVITYDEMLACPHEFAPDLDKLTQGSPAPLQAGPDGKYPVPMPGKKRDREY